MMQSEWEGTAWAGSEPAVQAREVEGSLSYFIDRLRGANAPEWRMPSVREALGVPAYLRCVTLISHTAGALTVQVYRNAALMDNTPALIARPDPYNTARDFYRDSAWNLATRGEVVWYIANRDSDGYPSALVVVPLNELTVEANPRNRLFPKYTWGDVESTRYSPANLSGRFVHVTYAREPGDLRGLGPLQLARAAVSVSVESQEWAANFYADGGYPAYLVKSAVDLSGTKRNPDTWEPDPDEGLNEAEILRSEWTNRANNTVRVIDPKIESVTQFEVSEAGAQMLASRDYQVGEAARTFGLPGALLEYGAPGSSLTYQNIAEVWNGFMRGCLSISYLEPMEQALSDCLPRSQASRFRTEGFLRADHLTRWQMYEIMTRVLGQEVAAQVASEAEGITPGNPEVAPIPFAPPAAIPSSLPEVRSEPERIEVRCDNLTSKRRGGISKLEKCNRLLSTTGAFVGQCPRCHKEYAEAVA